MCLFKSNSSPLLAFGLKCSIKLLAIRSIGVIMARNLPEVNAGVTIDLNRFQSSFASMKKIDFPIFVVPV